MSNGGPHEYWLFVWVYLEPPQQGCPQKRNLYNGSLLIFLRTKPRQIRLNESARTHTRTHTRAHARARIHSLHRRAQVASDNLLDISSFPCFDSFWTPLHQKGPLSALCLRPQPPGLRGVARRLRTRRSVAESAAQRNRRLAQMDRFHEK